MNKYSIELFTRLDSLRNEFDYDNIYCYYLLLLFIKEIFLENEHSEEIYLSLQESLKITIEAILIFSERKNEEECFIDNENFDINNIDDFVKLLNVVNNYLDHQNNYFIKNNEIIKVINSTIEKISKYTDNGNLFHEMKDDCLVNENLRDVIPNDNSFYKMIESRDDFEEKYKDFPDEDIFVENRAKNIIKDLEKIENKDDIKIEEIENTPFFIKEDKLKDFNLKELNPNYLKEFLLRKDIFLYKCVRCGINSIDKYPIPLYLNFIDGNKNNTDLKNLEFLCPNCNSIYGSGVNYI